MNVSASTADSRTGRASSSHRPCPACGGALDVFFEVPSVPVFCNVLWETPAEAAAAPRAPIALGWCSGCGLIFNTVFDARRLEYCPRYENALHFSTVFCEYADTTAQRLVDTYELDGRTILEIGCGQGDFLRRLCQDTTTEGIGFDPGFDPNRAESLPSNVTVHGVPFPDRPLEFSPDFICCRHVLEHIEAPLPFLQNVCANGRSNGSTVVFFEVPNALWTIRHFGVWDVIYEHCTYFTPEALDGLFRRAGFDVLGTTEAYGGQFLTIEARALTSTECEIAPPSQETRRYVSMFARAWRERVESWRNRLATLTEEGGRAVIWGGGSKGVTFLNVLDAGPEVVAAVVDQNPHKTGRFVPGPGQPVITPQELPQLAPDLVIVMNPLYRDEIATRLDELGLDVAVEIA